MEGLIALIIEKVVLADRDMQVTMGRSLKQRIQELLCRQEFEEARADYQKALRIADPGARINPLARLPTQVVLSFSLRPCRDVDVGVLARIVRVGHEIS